MKRRIYNTLTVLLFLAGVGILSYPIVSDLWNQSQQDKVVQGYKKVVDEHSRDELDAMRQEAVQYNEDLLKDEIIIDPFNQVKDRKADVRYYEILDPQDNGVMGTVRIPKIDVNLPIYHGTEEEVLQEAIGHLEQTSLPIGGAGTHAVISGHRGLPSAKLFTDLNLLEIGDEFYIDVLDETLAYQVDQINTVKPNELEDLAILSGEDHLTLVTCTPYAINSHRLLVRGTRVPYTEEKIVEIQKEQEKEERYEILPYVSAVIVVVVLIILLLIRGKRKKKKLEKTENKTGRE